MPTATYDLLSSTTLTSATKTVSFSSISGSYQDLVVMIQGSTTSVGSDYGYLRYNNDSGSYSYCFANGNGTDTASSAPGDNKIQLGARDAYTLDALTSLIQIEIIDYANTGKHKSALVRFGNPDRASEIMSSRWHSTSAITSVNLTMNAGNWGIGSKFNLYGIVG